MEKMSSLANEESLSLFYLVTFISLYSALIPTIVSLVSTSYTFCQLSFNNFSPFFKLVNIFIWDSQVETSLKRQVSDLKEELSQISMTDEFAKYSKIKRKLNKATDELSSKSSSVNMLAMPI